MDERGRLLIENVQPCFWPDPQLSPLRKIQKLSNQDKHNLLIALAMARSGREFVSTNVAIAEGTFRMAVGPVEHGQQVMSFRARPEDPEEDLQIQAHVNFQVAVEGYLEVDAVRLVKDLHNYVRHWIVESYERGYTPPKPEAN